MMILQYKRTASKEIGIKKKKYISTSLLIAIMASEKSAHRINAPETIATTSNHVLVWSKNFSSAKNITAWLKYRDDLKQS